MLKGKLLKIDFTLLILQGWDRAIKSGAVIFDPDIPNVYHEKIIGRYIKRLIPQRGDSNPCSEKILDGSTPVYLPFSETSEEFNFNKIHQAQEIDRIYFRNVVYRILASNSPLSKKFHLLLVPDEDRCHLINRLDLEVSFAVLETLPNAYMAFSSIGAGAGVNHMHMHVLGAADCIPVRSARRVLLCGRFPCKVDRVSDWPNDVYIFHGAMNAVKEKAFFFIQHLQDTNTPHNIVLLPNEVWVNPRSRKKSNRYPKKRFGTWETVLGIWNACSLGEYEVTESYFEEALQDIRISSNEAMDYNTLLIDLVGCR